MRMSFDDQIADGDKVVTRWTANGTHQGQLDAIPATGRLARISGIFIHQLTDGEITESWTSFDRLGLLQQLGVIPSADSAPTSAPLTLPPAGSAPPCRDGPLIQAAASRSPRACHRRKFQAQGARASRDSPAPTRCLADTVA
jgi:SnoaL-like polyketide cyclase